MKQANTITACFSAYLIGIAIFSGPIILIFLNLILIPPPSGIFLFLIIIFTALTTAFSWLSSIKIELDEHGITYHELFKKTTHLNYKEIVTIETASVNISKSSKSLPERLYIKNRRGDRKIAINTKLLSKQDIQTITFEIMKNIPPPEVRNTGFFKKIINPKDN